MAFLPYQDNFKSFCPPKADVTSLLVAISEYFNEAIPNEIDHFVSSFCSVFRRAIRTRSSFGTEARRTGSIPALFDHTRK